MLPIRVVEVVLPGLIALVGLRYAWSGTPITRAAGLGISLLAVSALLPRLPVTQTAAIEQGSEATFIAGFVVLFLAFAAWARPHGPAH